jgi:hypothetical protein
MSDTIDNEGRKNKAKKFLKWYGIAVVVSLFVYTVSEVLKSNEREKVAEETRLSDSLEQEKDLQRVRMHESRMASDATYRDSVIAADKRREDSTRKQQRIDSIAADERDRILNPSKYVDVDMSWKKGGFGAVAMGRFTFINKSKMTMVNPTITVSFYSENGTFIKSKEEVVYVTVKPGKRAKSEEINLGFISSQVTRAGSKLTSATWE